MKRRWWILAMSVVALLSGWANAQVAQDADGIAGRYLAVMQRKGYAFLSKDELESRRDQVAIFTRKHLRDPLDPPTRAAVLDGIDRRLDRLYASPAGKISYLNGFGSGGEEWMYLNDRDYFLTFHYYLWLGLTRRPLSPTDAQRRETQHCWMRQYLTDLPFRKGQNAPPREGMRDDEIRPWALAELEKSFADPLDLLSLPMPEEGFAKLQDRFKQFSNGFGSDLQDMEVAALTSRFPEKKDPAARFGWTRSGQLPFDDTVVALWGYGPSLHFASAADFRGQSGHLSRFRVYDIVRCDELLVDPAPPPASTEMETWLTREGRGELTLDGTTLTVVRGAKIANAPVMTWFDADKLSNDELRRIIRENGRDRISVEGLPPMNGPHHDDRSEGEFFIVAQNREGRLAVINLHNYEFATAMLWCRPRSRE